MLLFIMLYASKFYDNFNHIIGWIFALYAKDTTELFQ